MDLFSTNKLTLIKKNTGERIEGIKASVQQRKIFIKDVTVPVEKDDVFEQNLPSGIIQRLVVTNAHVAYGFEGPDHYEIDYFID